MTERPRPVDKRFKARSLSVAIADALREDILFGRRRQGEAVTQAAVAEEFKVSTMPVREALLALSREGMITNRTNYTFRVARMSRQDVEDIYWMHGLLAGELAERAAKLATPMLIEQLESLQAQLVEAYNRQDLDAVEDFNWQFHSVVNHASDSPKVLAILRSVVVQIPKNLYWQLQGAGPASIREHPMFIDALRNGRARLAKELWKAHAEEAGSLVIKYLSEHNYWDENGPDAEVASVPDVRMAGPARNTADGA